MEPQPPAAASWSWWALAVALSFHIADWLGMWGEESQAQRYPAFKSPKCTWPMWEPAQAVAEQSCLRGPLVGPLGTCHICPCLFRLGLAHGGSPVFTPSVL